VVFDTVGGETLRRSWSVLRPGGRMVTIVSDTANTADDRVKKAFFIVDPNQKQLSEIGGLLEARSLRPFVDTVVPFSQAPDLYAGRVRRRGRGKLVVAVAAEGSTKGKEDHEQQRTSSSSGT
jgi:NADPH:quinone reductase-like Zn-dependent oxidoreductase